MSVHVSQTRIFTKWIPVSLSSRFFKIKVSEGPSFITTHSSKGKAYFQSLQKEFCHFQPSRMDFCCPLFLFSFVSFFIFILSFALCRSALLSLGGEFTSQLPCPALHATPETELDVHSQRWEILTPCFVSSFLIIPIVKFSYHILTAPPLFYTVYLFPLVIFWNFLSNQVLPSAVLTRLFTRFLAHQLLSSLKFYLFDNFVVLFFSLLTIVKFFVMCGSI